VKSAFGWQEAAAGTMGYTLSQALTSGFQRSMYSNEAGMGSTPNAAAAASSPPHPAAQGFVQMVGVWSIRLWFAPPARLFFSWQRIRQQITHHWRSDSSGSDGSLTGSWGASFVAVIIIMFAFNSIIANYVYAENNLIFLRMNSRRNIWLLRIGILLMVLIGSQLRIPLLWHVADVMMAFMAITNMTAILLLSPVVTLIAADYLRQRKMGVMPVFDPKRYPDINQQLAPGAWDDKTGS
jgi:AGCS family alanine or glycine:cation symporter